MKMSIGEYIRKLRRESNLTLTQLGGRIGIDSGALSKIENGRKTLDPVYLPIIANIFILDLEVLKNEYFSEKIANEILNNSCDIKVLKLAEQKVKYLKSKKSTQIKLKF